MEAAAGPAETPHHPDVADDAEAVDVAADAAAEDRRISLSPVRRRREGLFVAVVGSWLGGVREWPWD